MTREEKLEVIRQKCIEANADIAKRPSVLSFNGRNPIGVPDNNGPEIRLADVLLAIGLREATRGGLHRDVWFDEPSNVKDGRITLYLQDMGRLKWNLRADDLTQQSPECIDFLHDLLTPTDKES